MLIRRKHKHIIEKIKLFWFSPKTLCDLYFAILVSLWMLRNANILPLRASESRSGPQTWEEGGTTPSRQESQRPPLHSLILLSTFHSMSFQSSTRHCWAVGLREWKIPIQINQSWLTKTKHVFVERFGFSFRVSQFLWRIVLLLLEKCEANCWSKLSACHAETAQSHQATSSGQHLTVQHITGAIVTLAWGDIHSSSPNLHPSLSFLKATPPCSLRSPVLNTEEMSQTSIPHHTVFQDDSASLKNKWTDKQDPR